MRVCMTVNNPRCPICNGSGVLDRPKHGAIDDAAAKRAMARALHEHGYSFRQVMRLVGWKSTRSVSQALGERATTLGGRPRTKTKRD